jgi:hypothetical protein
LVVSLSELLDCQGRQSLCHQNYRYKLERPTILTVA